MADQVDSTLTHSATGRDGGAERRQVSFVRRFLELIRFSHTVFALPFALLACAMAFAVPFRGEAPTAWRGVVNLAGVLACMVFARSAAMAFNRLVDAKFDAANPRTAGRHIPAGQLTPLQVALFFAAMCLGFLTACLVFLPNWLPIALAVPVLLWICGYSFAKRFTSAAHLWLGVALALSPICAWIAIRGEEVLLRPADLLPALGLAVAIALWVAGFDIIYACQDADFDRRSGLQSVPSRLGVAGALRLSAGLHVAMLLTLFCLPLFAEQLSLGMLYYFALSLVALLIVRQHAIISPTDLARVNVAFFHINAIISFTLSLAAGLDAWLR